MRRDEAQFWLEFSQRRPLILGALLDAAVAGLRNLPQTRVDQPPRLADFALWVSACEEALGMQPGEAVAACRVNSAVTRDLALESSPLYEPLPELAREGSTGTVAELRVRLDSMVSDAMRSAGLRPPAASAMRFGAWHQVCAPRASSFNSAATTSRAGAWSPWLVLLRFRKRRQSPSVRANSIRKRPFEGSFRRGYWRPLTATDVVFGIRDPDENTPQIASAAS